MTKLPFKLPFKLAAIILPFALMTTNVNAKQDNYKAMHKQLNIMSNIIKSSVNESQEKGVKVSNISSIYLKGQGVVFTINSGSHSRSWGNYNLDFSMPEIPDFPNFPQVVFSDEERRHIDESVSQAMESASQGYERAMEVFQEQREKSRELEEEKRDLAYELRDVEREKRDITYQIKRADEQTKKDLTTELKTLEKKQSIFEKSKKAITEKVAELKQKQQKRAKEQEKERKRYYQSLTTTLSDTLCLYGNGLKALPKNENVSLILKSAGDKDGRSYRDRIFVFAKKDITACSMDKINASQLLSKGSDYQF